jgi:hypothetical protein
MLKTQHALIRHKEHTEDMSETLAVFQLEISELRADADSNICKQK